MHPKPILLVEDNPDDVKLTMRAFNKNRLLNPVLLAKDGREALDILFGEGDCAGQAPVCPQVILLDLKLPKIGGLEVLRRVRADDRTRTIPVVILTSSQQEEDLVTGYQLGANSYIRKPVDFEQFVEAARLIGTYWLALNEPIPDRKGN